MTVPKVLERDFVDVWYKSNDKDSFSMVRRMIKEEGLLGCGSVGSAMSTAMSAAKDLRPGECCVIILVNSVSNYMTKLLSDQWMMDKFTMYETEESSSNHW